MKQEFMKMIKNDMKEIRRSKKDMEKEVYEKLKELEKERKKELSEFGSFPEEDPYRQCTYMRINKRYDDLKRETVEGAISQWHNDQSYYLIYKDGSEACITAGEILAGEKFPKLSMIKHAPGFPDFSRGRKGV